MEVKDIPFRAFLGCTLVAVPCFFGWIEFTRINPELRLSKKLDCVSYEPAFSRTHDPKDPKDITPEAIERDLRVISTFARCVRLYRVSQDLDRTVEIASRLGLEVILGTFLVKNHKKNKARIDRMIKLSEEFKNIRFLMIGNELVLHMFRETRRDVTVEELIDYIEYAKARSKLPVSTSEPIDSWKGFPNLVRAVDLITLHVIPYWYLIPLDESVSWIMRTRDELHAIYPEKEIFLGETGWPTRGPTRGPSVPSVQNQLKFLDNWIEYADKEGLSYNYIEAIDQPWKSKLDEGWVGAHWGVVDNSLEPKVSDHFDLHPRGWGLWAVSQISFLTLLTAMFAERLKTASSLAIVFFLSCIFVLTLVISLFIRSLWLNYILYSWIIGVVLIACVFLFLVSLHFIRESLFALEKEKDDVDLERGERSVDPLVSIHLPCSKEDPDVVIAALKTLVATNYPKFEIVVIENNNQDESLWRPIERFAADFENIKFFHEDVVSGFKAGALNYALERTHPEAEFVAVVDSDYQVDPEWLRFLVDGASDERVAVVQGPQAYRDFEDSWVRTAMRDEYEGFFRIGMSLRDEANAIIQHGTLCLIRKSALEKVGGWNEESITEDTDLGVRLLRAGHRSVYRPKVIGAGLTPFSLSDYKKQRLRWAFGGMRVLITYWRDFFLPGPLTWAQRREFVGGWLPWVGDLFYPLFAISAVLLASVTLAQPRANLPHALFFPLIFYVLFRLTCVFLCYQSRVPISFTRVLASIVAGASLTPTISKAVALALIGRRVPFQRTAKSGGAQGFNSALSQ